MSEGGSTILVVDDDLAACNLLVKILKQMNYSTLSAQGGAEALRMLASTSPDLVISDIRMPEVDGYAVLSAVKAKSDQIPVILLTAFGDVDGAMEAIRKGAHDYLAKPYQLEDIHRAVGRALAEQTHRRARDRDSGHHPPRRLSSIVGTSPSMLEVYKMVARIAPSDVFVLIRGESGTGKELVAKAIHEQSDRRKGPFVAVNCAGLSEGVLESELFGHEKGAFTGAERQHRGLFEEAGGGTLFLDEIGSIGPKMQAQLLRVLQEGELRRVGGSQTINVDVRVLSATNRDLTLAVADTSFREDLYYRLNVVTIQLPPLRERRQDIPLLVDYFIQSARRHRQATVTPEAQRLLEAYSWPGNVRELENTIARAMALCRGDVIVPADLPPAISGQTPAPVVEHRVEINSDIIGDRPTLEELSRRYAQLILREESGNKSRAAQRLGIDRKTLYRLVAEEEELPRVG